MSIDCGCSERHGDSHSLTDPLKARQWLIDEVIPCGGSERVNLSSAHGRVLAEPLTARLDLPGVDNSAMDGYALRRADLTGSSGLAVSARIPAGVAPEPLLPGSCARIFTGAPVPRGADCVVPQEQVSIDADGLVNCLKAPITGQHIRRRGEEVQIGDPLLKAGTVINAITCAMLASQGLREITVRRRVRVALLCTGSELVTPGTPLAPGQLYNSNAAMLSAALTQQQAEVLDFGIIADHPEDLERALLDAAETTDLIVCSGGVSVGEEDHVRPCLERVGAIHLHGVAMKPGKPFTFGHIGDTLEQGTPVIALPGNPSAALIAWQMLGQPCLQRRQGRTPAELERWTVEAGFDKRAPRQRRELLRVCLEPLRGTTRAMLAGAQGSNMIRTAHNADGYLMVEPGNDVILGEHYTYLPASQFLC